MYYYRLTRSVVALSPFFIPLQPGDVVEVDDEFPTGSPNLVAVRKPGEGMAIVQRDWLEKACPFCGDPLLAGEDLIRLNGEDDGGHRECVFRSVSGSVGHMKGECSCVGKEDHSEDGMTPREAARAALAWARANNWPPKFPGQTRAGDPCH